MENTTLFLIYLCSFILFSSFVFFKFSLYLLLFNVCKCSLLFNAYCVLLFMVVCCCSTLLLPLIIVVISHHCCYLHMFLLLLFVFSYCRLLLVIACCCLMHVIVSYLMQKPRYCQLFTTCYLPLLIFLHCIVIVDTLTFLPSWKGVFNSNFIFLFINVNFKPSTFLYLLFIVIAHYFLHLFYLFLTLLKELWRLQSWNFWNNCKHQQTCEKACQHKVISFKCYQMNEDIKCPLQWWSKHESMFFTIGFPYWNTKNVFFN